ncbi:MAG: hypothetical protein Q8Q50_01080 [Methylobacter sp.]|nr:hypothetical protein [Methylobacter sp.]
MTKYIGWVPTVGRRLSYSIIGSSSHPSVAETANVADDKKRRILSLQKRTLIDSALPVFKSPLVRLLFKLSGSFVFFLDAESNNSFSSKDQLLRGKLYLFTDHEDEEVDKNVLRIIEAINNLNNFDSPLCSKDIDSLYSEIYQKFLKDIEKHSLFCARFSLDRDGIIEIEINTDKDIEHTVCAQFFFFIKDISHRHQHHHPKTDTILDIYRKDNPYWQDEVLRALYKRVLDFKRSRDQWVCSSALGILSYIKAFKKVCQEKKMEITASRDDDDLSESIKITENELRHITSQVVGFRNTLVTITLAIVGVILMLSSLGTIANPTIQIPSCARFIRFVSGSIINSPTNTFLTVSLISLGVSSIIYRDYWMGKLTWPKDSTRILIGFRNQVVSGGIMLLLSAIFAYAARWIFNLIDKLESFNLIDELKFLFFQ